MFNFVIQVQTLNIFTNPADAAFWHNNEFNTEWLYYETG
jgi:hypothetical protein